MPWRSQKSRIALFLAISFLFLLAEDVSASARCDLKKVAESAPWSPAQSGFEELEPGVFTKRSREFLIEVDPNGQPQLYANPSAREDKTGNSLIIGIESRNDKKMAVVSWDNIKHYQSIAEINPNNLMSICSSSKPADSADPKWSNIPLSTQLTNG